MNYGLDTKVSAVITYGGENGEDSYEMRLEGAEALLEQSYDRNYVEGNTTFTLTVGTYTVQRVDGLITKGAEALWADKYPDEEQVPFIGSGATGDGAKYRRKAKAVLEAAGVL